MNKEELKKKLAAIETVEPEADELEFIKTYKSPSVAELIPWKKTERRLDAKTKNGSQA